MPNEAGALVAVVLGTFAGLIAAWVFGATGRRSINNEPELRQFSLRRVVIASAVLIPAWGLLTVLLLLLPPVAAIVCLFTGLALFMAAEQLYCRWCAGIGGVLMFAGVFAAALHGALK